MFFLCVSLSFYFLSFFFNNKNKVKKERKKEGRKEATSFLKRSGEEFVQTDLFNALSCTCFVFSILATSPTIWRSNVIMLALLCIVPALLCGSSQAYPWSHNCKGDTWIVGAKFSAMGISKYQEGADLCSINGVPEIYERGMIYDINITSTKSLAHKVMTAKGRISGNSGKEIASGGSCRWKRWLGKVTHYQWTAPTAENAGDVSIFALCGRSRGNVMQVAPFVVSSAGTPAPTTPSPTTSSPTQLPTVALCSNGVKDGAESDVDCGQDCSPCIEGKQCNVNSDCKTGRCDSSVCTVTSSPSNSPTSSPTTKTPTTKRPTLHPTTSLPTSTPTSLPKNAVRVDSKLKGASAVLMPKSDVTGKRFRLEVPGPNMWIGVAIGREGADNAMDGARGIIAVPNPNTGGAKIEYVEMHPDLDFDDWTRLKAGEAMDYSYLTTATSSVFEFVVPYCKAPACKSGDFDETKEQLLITAYGNVRSGLAGGFSANQHTSSGRAKALIVWSTGSTESATGGWKRPMHGIVMIAAFAVLMPIGALFPMFCRESMKKTWFYYHQNVQLASLLVATVGIAAIMPAKASGTHFKLTHEIFGIALYAILFVQCAIAVLRPHTTTKRKTPKGFITMISKRRASWSFFHHMFGLLLLLGGAVNCYIGSDLIEAFNPGYGDTMMTVTTLLTGCFLVILLLRIFQLFCVRTQYDANVSDRSLSAKPSWVQKSSPHHRSWKNKRNVSAKTSDIEIEGATLVET